MKNERIWNLIGCVLGAVIIVVGIVFATTPAHSYSTNGTDRAKFGADFYTYTYDGIRAAANNTAVTANNLREIGGKLALYSGFLFMAMGALVVIHFGKLLTVGTEPKKEKPKEKNQEAVPAGTGEVPEADDTPLDGKALEEPFPVMLPEER